MKNLNTKQIAIAALVIAIGAFGLGVASFNSTRRREREVTQYLMRAEGLAMDIDQINTMLVSYHKRLARLEPTNQNTSSVRSIDNKHQVLTINTDTLRLGPHTQHVLCVIGRIMVLMPKS